MVLLQRERERETDEVCVRMAVAGSDVALF